MQRGFGPILGRVVAIIAGLLLLGLVLRLTAAILSPVLPPALMGYLTGGWDMLFNSLLGPALPAIMAAVILGAICWIVIGRRH
jgi:hypothetical protein